jgi:lysophospholipase L1-like esterase
MGGETVVLGIKDKHVAVNFVTFSIIKQTHHTMKYRFLPLLFGSIALLFACTHAPMQELTPDPPEPPVTVKETVDILCLGDSYTKGEGIVATGNFPNQLKDSLIQSGYTMLPGTPRIIAQTGWRTDQLKTAITNATEIKDSTFSLVTLCIGVNNQYQGVNFEQYAPDFEALLQTALARAGGRKERVFVLSIPDWAFTPFGQNSSDPYAISQKIDAYNAVNQQLATQYGVHYINVTPISRQGLVRTDLVATDKLHPSARQYTEWIKQLLPLARTALK